MVPRHSLRDLEAGPSESGVIHTRTLPGAPEGLPERAEPALGGATADGAAFARYLRDARGIPAPVRRAAGKALRRAPRARELVTM